MKGLNLPTYSLKIKSKKGLGYVYDVFRKKYVRLTPEEWVRQNFAHYLVKEKNYPASRIIIEKTLHINRLVKRCDMLVCNDKGDPVILIECKSPEVKISQEAFEQVAIYNINFRVEYLLITNGIKHFFCRVNFITSEVEFLNEIPDYQGIR